MQFSAKVNGKNWYRIYGGSILHLPYGTPDTQIVTLCGKVGRVGDVNNATRCCKRCVKINKAQQNARTENATR